MMDELRSEEKEEKEAHLEIGNNMCKDPVAGRSTASTGEEPGSLEQGEPRERGRHRVQCGQARVGPAEAPGH